MIRLIASIPSLPLPDPLWYGFLQRIFPEQPDIVLDLVQITSQAEYTGFTIVDYILYNYGGDAGAQYPRHRHSIHNGIVLLLSERDIVRWQDIELPVPFAVQCYEHGHPEEWVERYPDRLWVTRFWFGGPVWLSYLGCDHIVFDIPPLLSPAWKGVLSRLVGFVGSSHAELVEHIPGFLNRVCETVYGGNHV
ncbi:MAG: hypothetical protein KatS3mg023_3741 [Armatimonadota bacterium]|nr:MAG: hypothetical protein KatS3mg023_3741 [Armatimonadota bacterium]